MELSVLGIAYPIYEQLFPTHVAAYARQFQSPTPRKFELPCLGFAPLEGMDAMLATAAPPRPLPDHVQETIDRQAWQEAAECQRHYYERRRRDLMARHD